MNTFQASVAVSPVPAINPDQAISTAKITEWSILAVVAIFLIRYLVRANEKLTEGLLEELRDDNNKNKAA
jgi:hypothetical protein